MTHAMDRRKFVTGAAAGASTALLARPAVAQGVNGNVVIIGGGFAGATCARVLSSVPGNLSVTLVEPNETYTACPFSNLVIAGLRDIHDQEFGYEQLAFRGVKVLQASASNVDADKKLVTLSDGASLTYDRLIVAPGIDIRWDGLPGYNEAAANVMPHAWKAGAQTLLLRKQLEAMDDGGLVVMSAPENPFRCPPGPYERASLIAHYLKTKKPKSKLLLLDAKDVFSKQHLFQDAWKALYGDMLEWVSLSSGGKVISVDPQTMVLKTDFATHKAQVANVIPPQKAGKIAELAGVTDRSGWCPIDPVSFESRLRPGIHVVGDAAIAGAMPKSAFAANAQAKACAVAVAMMLADKAPVEPRLINTCYSLVSPDYGITVAGVYKPTNGQLMDIPGAGGTSPLNAPAETRRQEAVFANGWFETITAEVFG
ncbi:MULTISPECIES: NAD(P)/FAD-dependent oxidoreductase [unclassified Beijerinckia]|uniref:NAD(P)/FAD-dependent oxidoreductase n=1 Tax=unclassified Beijerinckia TaxID=2638183 RepID=UPI00089BB698|nr:MULTISPECIES: NAD(P)/FAD-dependent oxidoreductase [unclassified Beijerinckia]MDH7794366.1 sulfide dehydrogenase [flavocytochrome c] flavoprotein subunit [Beijerinckia sp. GAS462]SEB60085.1 sulfide dehydrogenase (flavocytochrome c), flavoprotein subunit [Beijerinckia sp. 28-YEA-48]